MGHLLQPVQGPDVVEGVDTGAESAVQAEDLAVHQGGQGEVVEQVGEVPAGDSGYVTLGLGAVGDRDEGEAG